MSARAEIARLKFQLARYRRAEFGRSSEKLAREATEQLELAIEALETDQAERLASDRAQGRRPIPRKRGRGAEEPSPPAVARAPAARGGDASRRPPACPSCGRRRCRRVGEDATQNPRLRARPLQGGPARPREALLPDLRHGGGGAGAGSRNDPRSRRRGVAGAHPGLEVRRPSAALSPGRFFAREGVGLETSTLSGWVGATAAALKPLVDALAANVFAGDTLYVDDTPVPVLAPGTGKTKTGRLWTYVRDERPFAGSRPPAALFFYSPDRKGEHPKAHLQDFQGVIHADGYAGFNGLFAGNRIAEAACWAHVRRKFFDVHAANGSSIAKQALDRIGDLYGVEKTITGLPPDLRRAERQKRSKPIVAALGAWAEMTLPKLSRKSELARAFRYMRSRWKALLRCFDDGRLALDNNPAERALRGVAIGRKNYLFAGSDAGPSPRRSALFADRDRQAEPPRPPQISRRRAHQDRRSPSSPNRRSAALALETRPAGPRRRLTWRVHQR